MTPQTEAYARRHNVEFGKQLGFGRDGTVISTRASTAVKFFTDAALYARERDAYLIFVTRGTSNICGHHVPQLVDFDDELQAMEMTIVEPPYLLDFASAYPEHEAPDFPDEIMEDWLQSKREEFGPRWPQVERVLDTLRADFGLVLLDINPANITFADEPPAP